MRTKEIRKWIDEGGSLPQDLTQEEHRHLSRLGWRKVVMEYDNGQKEFEHHFLHGKKHGKWEGWEDDGQKDYEENWLHGKLHGKWERWYYNGQKWFEHHFLHGKEHGKQEGWWENGQKKCEHHCFHGMKHGVFKEWYEDGNLFRGEEYYYGNKIKETS